jgi:hypothetical protein
MVAPIGGSDGRLFDTPVNWSRCRRLADLAAEVYI